MDRIIRLEGEDTLSYIERLLRGGGEHAQRSLTYHWPSSGDNDVGESTVLLSIAHVLSVAGCYTYSEVPYPTRKERLDLLAILDTGDYRSKGEAFVLGMEGKRLHSNERAAEIASDWSRIQDLRLSGAFGSVTPGLPAYRAVSATTWSQTTRDWWCNSSRRSKGPPGCWAKGWSELGQVLSTATVVGALELLDREEDGGWKKQFFMYALAAVPGTFDGLEG